MDRGVRQRVWIGLVSLCVGGCSPIIAMSDSRAHVVPNRMIALPPVVSEIELDTAQRLTPRPDWQAEATTSVEASVGCRVGANGGRGPSGVKWNLGDPSYADFRHWSNETLTEIVLTVTGKMSRRHLAVTEFQFGGDSAHLKKSLGADFALVTLFRDGGETTSQSVVNVLGYEKTFVLRDGVACVVDLSDGHIVWCQYDRIPNPLTLRPRPEAQEFVDRLLRNLRGVSATTWIDGGPRELAAIRGSDCGSEFRARDL